MGFEIPSARPQLCRHHKADRKMKKKWCDKGNHEVNSLWLARKTDKQTGEIIQPATCKSCMARTTVKKSKAIKEDKKEINVFFASQALIFPMFCENCGERLDSSSMFARRAQTCHILPKRKNMFKSVATHPQNKMFMCCFHGCHGHGTWDNTDAERRKRMKVYELAIERYRQFEDVLTEAERIKAEKYLGL